MKQIKFYEVYDLRAMYDKESAACYESVIDTLEDARKAAKAYGSGVIYECEEKPMMTIDIVCPACDAEYCVNVPATIGDFFTECHECGKDAYVHINSIVEKNQ